MSMEKRTLTDWQAFHKEKDSYPPSEWPKVSIIIPTFNCVQTIALTIESLLEQDYPNYEIIIVDGGSKDRTLEMVKAFRQDHIRIYSFPPLYNVMSCLIKGFPLLLVGISTVYFQATFILHSLPCVK